MALPASGRYSMRPRSEHQPEMIQEGPASFSFGGVTIPRVLEQFNPEKGLRQRAATSSTFQHSITAKVASDYKIYPLKGARDVDNRWAST